MSTTDRSHRDSNELVDIDDLADPQLEPAPPDPVVVNADAENAAAVQRQVDGESEEGDLESIHRRVFIGDGAPPPPPPRTWDVGGPDDGESPGARPPAADDDPIDRGDAADAWSRRRGPPAPVAQSFTGEGSWAAHNPRPGADQHATAHGPSWARPSLLDSIVPAMVTETPWARS